MTNWYQCKVKYSKEECVRGAVASNRATPVDLLGRLSTDSDFAVRLSVVRNRATPVDLLGKIAEDENEWSIIRDEAEQRLIEIEQQLIN